MRRIADSSPLKVVRVEAAKERLDEEQQTVKAGIPQIEVLTVFDRSHLWGGCALLSGMASRKPETEADNRRARRGDRREETEKEPGRGSGFHEVMKQGKGFSPRGNKSGIATGVLSPVTSEPSACSD